MSNSAITFGSTNLTLQGAVGFKNKIINGNFDIWQRGTTPGTMPTGLPSGEYSSADRWKITGYKSGVGYGFVSLTQLTTALPTGVLYAAKVASTDVGNDGVRVGQIIESANTYSLVGQRVTISLKVKKLAGYNAAAPIQIELFSLNAKDTSPTEFWNPGGNGATTIQLYNHTPATSDWETVTFTTSVLPAAAANGLVLSVAYSRTDMGAADIFAIAQVQLETGTIATPFEQRPIGAELALCQRYYWKISDIAPTDIVLPLSMGTGASAAIFSMNNPVPMRIKPSSINATLSIANASASIVANVSPTNNSGSSIIWSAFLGVTNGVTLTANQVYRTLINGSGFYIEANAEL
jgi:hypothetical protein